MRRRWRVALMVAVWAAGVVLGGLTLVGVFLFLYAEWQSIGAP